MQPISPHVTSRQTGGSPAPWPAPSQPSPPLWLHLSPPSSSFFLAVSPSRLSTLLHSCLGCLDTHHCTLLLYFAQPQVTVDMRGFFLDRMFYFTLWAVTLFTWLTEQLLFSSHSPAVCGYLRVLACGTEFVLSQGTPPWENLKIHSHQAEVGQSNSNKSIKNNLKQNKFYQSVKDFHNLTKATFICI